MMKFPRFRTFSYSESTGGRQISSNNNTDRQQQHSSTRQQDNALRSDMIHAAAFDLPASNGNVSLPKKKRQQKGGDSSGGSNNSKGENNEHNNPAAGQKQQDAASYPSSSPIPAAETGEKINGEEEEEFEILKAPYTIQRSTTEPTPSGSSNQSIPDSPNTTTTSIRSMIEVRKDVSLYDIPSLLDSLKYYENKAAGNSLAATAIGKKRVHALNSLAEILWKYGEKARRILIVDNNVIQSLVTVMWDDISDSKVQVAALAVLYLLLSSQFMKSCADMIAHESDSLCVTVLFAMQTHLSNKTIQLHSIGIFSNLALASSHNGSVVDGTLSGAVLTVVNAMSHHNQSHDIQKSGLQALYYQCHLSIQAERNKRTLMECCGLLRFDGRGGGGGGGGGGSGGSSATAGIDVVLAAIQTVKDLPVAMDWAQRLCGSLASPQDLEEAISISETSDQTQVHSSTESSNSEFILMEATYKVIASRYSTLTDAAMKQSIKLSADSNCADTDITTKPSVLPSAHSNFADTSASAESKAPLADIDLQSNEFDIWLRRVQQDFQALRQAPDEIRRNKRIVTEAVKQEGAALLFALGDLLEDKELVLLAVRNRGLALQFAGGNLRSDKEVVLAAVISNHNALKFANVELRQDRECLIAAGMFDYSDYDIDQSRSAWRGTTTTATKTTKRIALSTRFSLQPTSRSQATNFTYLFKRHEYIRTRDFHVYVPNAFNKKTCDPNWTDFDWPCRGTNDTCKLLDASHNAGRPTDQSCWRYSFRCQLAAARATGGFMLQIVERENSLEHTHQILGNGQKIEEDMAHAVGTKIFQVHRPLQGVEGENDDVIDAVEDPFDSSDIEKVIAEIQRWYDDGCHDKSVCTIRLWHPIPGSPISNRISVSSTSHYSAIDSLFGTIQETEEDPVLFPQIDVGSGFFDSVSGTIGSEFAIASDDAVVYEQNSRVSGDTDFTIASEGAFTDRIPRPIQTLQRSQTSGGTDCVVASEAAGIHHIPRPSQIQQRGRTSGATVASEEYVLHDTIIPLPDLTQQRSQTSGTSEDFVIHDIPRPSQIQQRGRTSGATVGSEEPVDHETKIPRPNETLQRSRTTGTDYAVATESNLMPDYNQTFHPSHPLSTPPQRQPLKASETFKIPIPRLSKLFKKGSLGTWRSKSA